MKGKLIHKTSQSTNSINRKGFGFSKDKQRNTFLNLKKNNYPGPGFYNTNNQKIISFKIRDTQIPPSYIEKRLVSSLGPGFYNFNQNALSVHQGNVKFSFTKNKQQRFIQFKRLKNPGPGEYKYCQDKSSGFGKSPSFKLSQTIRSQITDGLIPQNPGPGSYQFKSLFGDMQNSPKLSRYTKIKSKI